ncbi:TATA-binding protein-associated factor, partial [Paragonimus westermani]
TCVQTAYHPDCLQVNKRSSSPQSVRFGCLQHSAPKHAHIRHTNETRLSHEESHFKPASSSAGLAWPLDSFCTTLLGDLWALRWETRHGAASGLRELLGESRHTKHCGKHGGMSEQEMYLSHSRYIEDIVVRVLCTLALDQLSDFISDEVVAPVRETAAQLLGVLSLHLTVEQVLLVSKHLVHLVTLGVAQGADQIVCESRTLQNVACKNSWMIAHGGLLGIKYLLASRKDLRGSLLPHVSSCLVAQLLMPAQTKFERGTVTQFPLDTGVHSGADEDIRAAAASALLPVIGEDCFSTLGSEQTLLLTDHVWSMLRDFTTDLSPSTGPLLRLVSALTSAISEYMKTTCEKIPDKLVSEFWNDSKRFSTQVHTVARLLHHVSSGIRLQALYALRCLFAAQSSQPRMSPEVLQLIVDQLFHRVILETCSNLRNRATNLCIDIVQSTDLPILAQACVDRLDFWLCQTMQPVGVPFPRHLFAALIPPFTTVSHNLADISSNPTIKTEYVTAVDEGEHVDMPSPLNDETMAHCIAGSQFPNDAPCQIESYVWQTRICAV